MKSTLLTVTLLASCYSPPWEADERLPKVYNQDKAMLFTEGLLEDHYGWELGNLFEDVDVHWVTENECFWQDSPGMMYNGQCVAGVTFSCSEIYVAVELTDDMSPGDVRTHGTALLHEFGHCALMHLGLDPDGDHSDSEFWNLVHEGVAHSRQRDW